MNKIIHIDFKSFFRKKPKKVKDEFGVMFINGRMGTGKTYLAVYLAYKYFDKSIKIKTNIHSLKIKDRDIEYFDKISDICNDFTPNTLYIIDEISRKYTKECRQDQMFYSWLQQSRKMKRYVLLITQEYILIPTWLRGVASAVYTTNKLKFLPAFCSIKGTPYLDPDTLEWQVQPFTRYVYKRNKYITKMYDTFETINEL